MFTSYKKIYFLTCYVLCVSVVLISTETAPEFTLSVDTENFKEVRIPMELWRKIITRNYNTVGKTNAVSKQAMNGTMLHEIVLNVVVPEDEIDETAQPEEVDEEILEKPALEDQMVMEPNLPLLEDTKPADVPAVQEAIEAVPAAADAVAPIADPIASPVSVLVQSTRFPCLCEKGICGCCATMFQQKGCAKMRFLPEEFAFEMKMTMNGRVMAKRILPVSDPPPFCFNPRRAPFLEVCAHITDISIKKENIHACVDLDANLGGFDLFSWNYDCIKFGRQGLITGVQKPDEGDDFDFFGGGGGFGGDDDDDDDVDDPSDDDEGDILSDLFTDDDDDYK